MDPRADHGPELNREAVEAALKWNGIVLSELLATWKIRAANRWPDHPLVRDFVTLTAAQVLQERGIRRGLSPTRALEVACAELGLSYPAVLSRLKRHRKAYMNPGRPAQKVGAECPSIIEKAG